MLAAKGKMAGKEARPIRNPPFLQMAGSQNYGHRIEYDERVKNFLNKYPKSQHALIMDLLDLQWVAFVQQLWFIRDETGFVQERNHSAVARLQIDSNIRWERGLPPRNMAQEMHDIGYCDLLVILENAARNADEKN